ncbi:hypothetical protein BLNAU_23273 [Blattamonas nauphoetae]|uniref:Uncharacterized protein n=1 Tax=Blattamonas nauphoetae TaxID=2049346 RepID=A0ABQ9WSW2_9EUKA|nr:hypothetical protein BLNAU_23273 [Blattamonas nauphoetae]
MNKIAFSTLTHTTLLTVTSPGLSLSNLDNFIPNPRQSPEYLQKIASKSLTNRNPTQQYYQQIMHDLHQSPNTPHLISHSLCLSKKPVVQSRPIPPKPRLNDNIDFISSTDQSEQRKTRSLSFHSHHITLRQITVPSFHQSSSGHSTDDGSLSASEKPDPQLVAVRPLLTRQSSFSMHGQASLFTSTPVISHAAIRSFSEAFEQEQELEAQNELLFGSDASEYEDETESEGSLSAHVEFQKIPSYELIKAIPQPVSAVVLSRLHEPLQLNNPYSLLHWPFINEHYKASTTQTVSKHRLREIEREAMEIQNEMLKFRAHRHVHAEDSEAGAARRGPDIGHTIEIHLTKIYLTSVTRKALLSEFDRVHRFRQSKTIPISIGKAGNQEPFTANTKATLNLSPFEPTLNTKIASSLTKLCTFSSGNVFNKIEQLRMIFPPSSPPGNLMSVLAPFIPITALGDHTYPFAPSLVQFTRQLVVQLASELHPQWMSVGDESDDGSVYSDDMDDMPMPNPSRHIPINSLCTIQFGDALAEALSILLYALLKKMRLEGMRMADEGQMTSFYSEMNVLVADRRVQLVAAISQEEANRIKALSRPASPLHQSGLTSHVALPCRAGKPQHHHSEQAANRTQPRSRHHVDGVLDEGHADPDKQESLPPTRRCARLHSHATIEELRHWLEAEKRGMMFGELVEYINLYNNYSFSNIDINDFIETG